MLLDGVRVISLCHYLQGPAAAQYLADMGADVIKVEPVGGAYERRWSGARVFVGEVSGFYLCANRNKRSICINLKSDEGRAVFLLLVGEADVVMENFRPGTLDRLGLGYDVLRKAKPDVIFASASGYGADGPCAELPGQDLLIQARSGLVATTAGQQQNILPAAAGCAVVDQHGAALFAMGITAALFKKLKTSEGTRVESSLFNAGIDLQQEALVNYINGNNTPDILERDAHLATWFHEAPYGIYQTADARHIALSLNAMDALYRALDEAAGEDNAAHKQSSEALDGYLERDRIAADIAERFLKINFDAAKAALDAHKIWYAPVANYSELAQDPQALHNNVFGKIQVDGHEAVLINHPNRYDGEVPPTRHMAEVAGQDTSAVLAEYGFSQSEIDELKQRKVVA